MNNHLTTEQISEYVAGASGAPVEEHVHACAVCRIEAERLSETLALFRKSARNWSLAQESARPLVPLNLNVPERRRVTLRQLGWAAALAACLIAGLSLPRQRVIKPVPTISDAELLVQVDRELSETVPPSMEPIALTKVKK